MKTATNRSPILRRGLWLLALLTLTACLGILFPAISGWSSTEPPAFLLADPQSGTGGGT